MIPLIGAALVAVMLALYLEHRSNGRPTRAARRSRSAQLGEVLEELVSLRSTLVASGAAERARQAAALSSAPRSVPAPALPSVERKVVSVTRDDDPVHTRATIEAPAPPDGERRGRRLRSPRAACHANDDRRAPSRAPSRAPARHGRASGRLGRELAHLREQGGAARPHRGRRGRARAGPRPR